MSATLAETGREIAAVAAERPAIVAAEGTMSFGELDQQADALAGHLAAIGLRQGDVLALLATNRPEWLVTYQAALRAGLRLVPINWHLEADDVAYVIADADARAIVVESGFAHLVPSSVPHHIDIDTGAFEQIVTGTAPAPTDRTRGSLMIYTSGTTGRPKGVRHDEQNTSDGSAIGTAMVAMMGMDGDRGDSMLCPAPLYHSGPSRLCGEWPLGAGVTVILMERFDPAHALTLIEHHAISHAFFVPTMFHRMLALENRGRYDVSSLRFVLHGAGPCPRSTKAAMFDWFGPIIHEIYAASEGPGTWIGPDEWLAHPGSVGRVDRARLEVRDSSGQAAATDEDGTVWFRATAPFEYHGDATKTEATHDAGGEWYTVGDRGRVDADGYLFLTGRTSECIVSGGVNIYPARIDEALAEHPDLVDGAAFGITDAELGETVAAAVVPIRREEPETELVESVQSHCRERLGSQHVPHIVHVVDELPRSDAGKLYRRRLVDAFTPPAKEQSR